jgi:pimeloyl-ACP methyl ester carboxylesterase
MIFFLSLIAIFLALAALDRFAPEPAARLALAFERKRAGLTVRQCAVDGWNLPYLEGGYGEVLILIHGFGGDKDNFTRVAGHLTPRYRVIVPDLPGFGDATRMDNASYSIADQVERLHAMFAALGLKQFHLGGNSMGGFIATEYAARFPAQVRSLWLLDAAGTEASAQTPVIDHYLASGEIPLLMKTTDGIDQMFKATMEKSPFLPRSLKQHLALRAVADFPLHTKIMQQVAASTPLEQCYQAIATPALITWGSADKILSPAGAAAFAAILPNSRTIIMKGFGHLPMVEAPRRTARDFMQFLSELPPTAPANPVLLKARA